MLFFPVQTVCLALLPRPLLHPPAAGGAARAPAVAAVESPGEPGKFSEAATMSNSPTTRACPLTVPALVAVRHNELSPGCAPLGVLCGGFSEDVLEDIADAVESVFKGPDEEGDMQVAAHIPIVPLAQGDMRLRLRDVLARLAERDSVLPADPIRLRTPLVLLSGFSPVQTSLAVRKIRALGLQSRAQAPEPAGFRWPWEREADDTEATASTFRSLMFAAVVPKALDKPLRVLCDELEGDHAENARERR